MSTKLFIGLWKTFQFWETDATTLLVVRLEGNPTDFSYPVEKFEKHCCNKKSFPQGACSGMGKTADVIPLEPSVFEIKPVIENQLRFGSTFPIMKPQGGDTVKYEIKIDAACGEPKVVIFTAEMTDEVNALIKKLSEDSPVVISGFKDDKIEILDPNDLIRVYANTGKVVAVTSRGDYSLRLRLYEVEDRLSKDRFVRISNSEIINLKKAQSFDLSLTGTISIKLINGTTSYVSRRYVPRIKKILGV